MKILSPFLINLFLLNLLFGQGAETLLNFNNPQPWGVNDQYMSLNSASLNFPANGEFTFEAWVNTYAENGSIFSFERTNHNGSAIRLNLGYDGITAATQKVMALVKDDNSNIAEAVSPNVTLLNDGNWHHLAITRSSVGAVTLYYDGIPLVVSSTNAPGAVTTDLRAIAKELTPLYWPWVARWLDATIDEFRIWDIERSETEICENMNKKLTGNESNLLLYFRLDDGSGSTANDLTSNNNDGTLINMSDASWITSTAPIGDQSVYTKSLVDINLASSDGDDMTVENIGGNPDFVALIRVDEGPNYNGGFPVVDPLRYWEVWVTGGTSPDYDLVYNYNGHPGISDENDLRLGDRADATITSWSDAAAALSTSLKTLTLLNQTSNKQYILASSTADNSLPVDLNTFNVKLTTEGIELKWKTFCELNNLGFEVWKKESNENEYYLISSYKSNYNLKGMGNSSIGREYQYIDNNFIQNNLYNYKLISIDLNGTAHSYGPISIAINRENMEKVFEPEYFNMSDNYPNPFNPVTYFNITLGQISDINLLVYNVLGQKVDELLKKNVLAGMTELLWDPKDLPTGIYIYKIYISADNAKIGKIQKIKTGKMFFYK